MDIYRYDILFVNDLRVTRVYVSSTYSYSVKTRDIQFQCGAIMMRVFDISVRFQTPSNLLQSRFQYSKTAFFYFTRLPRTRVSSRPTDVRAEGLFVLYNLYPVIISALALLSRDVT